MTEAEVLALSIEYSTSALTAFTVYASFTFAYLITAFYVGERLNSFQAIAASGMYVISAGSTVMAMFGYLQAQYAIGATKVTVLDSLAVWNADLWLSYMLVTLISGILISLYFMWQVRHPKTE